MFFSFSRIVRADSIASCSLLYSRVFDRIYVSRAINLLLNTSRSTVHLALLQLAPFIFLNCA
jgi:predicted TIM-barrel enzyme